MTTRRKSTTSRFRPKVVMTSADQTAQLAEAAPDLDVIRDEIPHGLLWWRDDNPTYVYKLLAIEPEGTGYLCRVQPPETWAREVPLYLTAAEGAALYARVLRQMAERAKRRLAGAGVTSSGLRRAR